MAKKLPFTFTPTIVRYLKHAVELHAKWTQGAPAGHSYGLLTFDLPTYEEGEAIFTFTEASRLSFRKYFTYEKINVIHVTGEEQRGLYYDKVDDWGKPGSFCLYKEKTHFIIRDIKPVLALWKTYLLQKDGPQLAVLDAEFEQVSFDDSEGRLTYLTKSYTLHKGKDGKALRLRLFRKLWDERMHIVNNKTTEKGRPMTMDALTKYLGKRPGKTDISNLGANLKKKGMPIRIQKDADSVLLIVNEDI